jgi:hypothetical protein
MKECLRKKFSDIPFVFSFTDKIFYFVDLYIGIVD